MQDAMFGGTMATDALPSKVVSVIDYGIGNLGSVCRAFNALGVKTQLVAAPEDILTAEYLVLPGVGAFEDGMNGLRSRNLIDAIREYAASGRPLLGICLGMQMLFTESEEFGIFQGLNIIPGRVVGMKQPIEVNQPGYKVPLIGWSPMNLPSTNPNPLFWKATLLDGIQPGAEVYHVHSFYPTPEHQAHTLATTTYGGQEMCSVVRTGNIMGTQFHPEKSGKIGMAMLHTFCSL